MLRLHFNSVSSIIYLISSSHLAGYLSPTCILSAEAAVSLSLVQREVMKKNFTLKVYDCYRPQMVCIRFFYFLMLSCDSTLSLPKPPISPHSLLTISPCGASTCQMTQWRASSTRPCKRTVRHLLLSPPLTLISSLRALP